MGLFYTGLHTDQLWVYQNHRNQGIARNIMNKAREFEEREGCKMATLQTMSFQNSDEFYKKLGYEIDFRRQNYTYDSTCFFMVKFL